VSTPMDMPGRQALPTLGQGTPDRAMMRDGTQHRARLSVAASRQADRVVRSAWLSLPRDHRELLEEIGASQWQTADRPLGDAANRFLRSAGHPPLPDATRRELDDALGVWIPKLRIVLVDVGHPRLTDLDEKSREAFIAHIAWHEWGHALSVARCTPEDVSAGERLLDLAPAGVRDVIRAAAYRPRHYTHELVAETYALLIARRRRQASGRPPWLHDEIYKLMRRATGWSD